MQHADTTQERIGLSDDTFHLVTVDGRRTLFETEEQAIEHLQNQQLDPDESDVAVVAVTVNDGDWQIRELPWQRIALQLLGGGDA